MGRYKLSSVDVCNWISQYFTQTGVLPGNREDRRIESAALRHYGSWNAAVIAAGHSPNTEWVQRKVLPCLDGHKADSVSEKIVDDWFHLQGIKHERWKRYPEGRYTCDFYLPDINQWVEYFGLSGKHPGYDIRTLIKRGMAVKHNLNLVEIVPSMLYPMNTLHLLFEGTSAPTEKVCVFASSKEELQVLVDSMPIEHIAKKFHVGPVTIRKECQKLKVDLPPSGHWQKRENRKKSYVSIA